MHSFTLATFLAFAAVFKQVASQSASGTLPNVVGPAPTNIGNASDIKTYPVCAQTCSNSTAISIAHFGVGLEYQCSALFRSLTAACEDVTCTAQEYNTTQTLAQQLCGPLYSNGSISSSSVPSAIASATSLADTVKGKDPFDLASYPQCAQQCSIANNYGGCAPTNATCLCRPPSSLIDGLCERNLCSPIDLQTTSALAYKLCANVGGIDITGVNTTNVSYVVPSNTSLPSATPLAFKGGASNTVTMQWTLWMGLFGIGVITSLVLL